MGKMATLRRLLKDDPSKIRLAISNNISHSFLSCFIPDKAYLKLQYKLNFGKKLNLKSPETFNEKLQWLKLYDRKSEYVQLVDKYRVREYIANKIGKEYLIPLIGVWDKFEDIDFAKLPNQFVLKCNHDSGSVIICKDKNTFNFEKAKVKLSRGLKRNLYYFGREWPYKDVPPKIIAEKYMVDAQIAELRDYKIFCFSGEPKIVLVCADRFTDEGLRENFYDLNWHLLNIQRPKHSNTTYYIKKPKNLDAMLSLARTLSQNIPFVRVDFYDINGEIYFGEMTFFPASGFERFVPEEWDYKLGEWIKLPDKN